MTQFLLLLLFYDIDLILFLCIFILSDLRLTVWFWKASSYYSIVCYSIWDLSLVMMLHSKQLWNLCDLEDCCPWLAGPLWRCRMLPHTEGDGWAWVQAENCIQACSAFLLIPGLVALWGIFFSWQMTKVQGAKKTIQVYSVPLLASDSLTAR